MSIQLPLDEMTIAEKLHLMELLWENLSRNPASLTSPQWHRDLLRERKHLVDEGKCSFIHWDDAVAEIREELRGNTNVASPA